MLAPKMVGASTVLPPAYSAIAVPMDASTMTTGVNIAESTAERMEAFFIFPASYLNSSSFWLSRTSVFVVTAPIMPSL